MLSRRYNLIGIFLSVVIMLLLSLGVINAQASPNLPASNQATQNVPTPYPAKMVLLMMHECTLLNMA